MEDEDNHVIQSICKTEAENPDNWLRWFGLLRELGSRYDRIQTVREEL